MKYECTYPIFPWDFGIPKDRDGRTLMADGTFRKTEENVDPPKKVREDWFIVTDKNGRPLVRMHSLQTPSF